MKKQKKEISTFKRLILTFLAIIFPIVVAGFCAIGFYGNKNEQESLSLVHTQMKYYMEKHEENIQEIRSRATALLNNQDLKQLANLPEIYTEYEKSRAILRVQHELDSIKSFQRYISGVSVLVPKLNRTIHATGNVKGSYTPLGTGEIEELGALRTVGESGLALWNGELVMPIFEQYQKEAPTVMILVRFSEKEMKKELSYAVNVADTLFFFVIPELGYELDDFQGKVADEMREFLLSWKEGENTVFGNWGNKKWYLFREDAPVLQGEYYKIIPAKNVIPTAQTLFFLSAFFCMAVTACIVIFLLSAHRLVNEPMKDLVAAFREVEKGNFKVRLEGREKNDFGYLYQGFNRMTENLQISIDKIYNQKMLIQRTELKQLQAQINPHFLYNSYFLLHRLIKKKDYEKATLFSKNMGTYFRYITRSGRDVVGLKEEDGHARIYAQMQGMRFEGRIRIEYGELPESCESIQVPRLIIQPILENAFGHGLENKERDGILRVTYHMNEEEDSLFLRIEDNGNGLRDEELWGLQKDFERQPEEREIQEVTGMVNINRRMKIFWGKDSGLYLSRSKLGGLCVEMRIRGGEKHVSASDCG